MVRRACSAAFLAGSTPGWVTKPHTAGLILIKLAQVFSRASVRRLVHAGLQGLAQPPLQRLELLGGGHAARASAEQHTAQTQQALPNAPGLVGALGNAGEVTEQVCPAHLALSGVDMGVAGVMVGHHQPPLSDSCRSSC